jgi:hypothetical protein
MKWITCAIAVAFVAVVTLCAQTATPAKAAGGLDEFSERIAKYAVLRGDLEKTVPPLTGSEDPARVVAIADSLAAKVRAARAGARQGDLFTPAAAEAFRKILREIDASSWRLIMDVNPGQFPQRINDSYPSDKPLSTMPPDLLARLPRLPEGVQYRFVGSTLILHDIKTNLVIDRLPEAIRMSAPPRRD